MQSETNYLCFPERIEAGDENAFCLSSPVFIREKINPVWMLASEEIPLQIRNKAVLGNLHAESFENIPRVHCGDCHNLDFVCALCARSYAPFVPRVHH